MASEDEDTPVSLQTGFIRPGQQVDATAPSSEDQLVQRARQIELQNAEISELKHLSRLAQRDIRALVAHSEDLERRLRRVLNSTTWRALGPVRAAGRFTKSALSGKKVSPNRIPKLPVLSSLNDAAPNVEPTSSSPAVLPERSAVMPEPTEFQPTPIKSRPTKIDHHAVARSSALHMLASARPHNEPWLRQEYASNPLSAQDETFVLYRIIGNDLYPRHKRGQSRDNLQFILENEPTLDGCVKRWVVNRISDPDEERRIVELLELHHQDYVHIPFVAEEFKSIGWDYEVLPSRDYLYSDEFKELIKKDPKTLTKRAVTALYQKKNKYLMNNNGARNAALSDGRGHAKWIMPWDGNCFVNKSAWEEIASAVKSRSYLKYFVVPMERVTDNSTLLRDDFVADPLEEPQIMFRSDAAEEFDAEIPYGRRPKVELFWRLGIPGPWDRWRDDPWDGARPSLSPEAGQFGVAGWVARLSSGVGALEQKDVSSVRNRGRVRQDAILAALDHVSKQVGLLEPDPDGLSFYSRGRLEQMRGALLTGGGHGFELARHIVEDAERVLVAEREHGKSRPFEDITALALGWYVTQRDDFARHGVSLLRAIFIDSDVRRYPADMVHEGVFEVAGYTISDFDGLFYLLDAVRLLELSSSLTPEESKALRDWFAGYLEWIESSLEGERELFAQRIVGTHFDLQAAAIAAFLDRGDQLRIIVLRAQSKIFQQFTGFGEQYEGLENSLSQHRVVSNLQGWLNLLQVASANGFPVGEWAIEPYTRLVEGLRWILSKDSGHWPNAQGEVFDGDRISPLAASALRLGMKADLRTRGLLGGPVIQSFKLVFHQSAGIAPYWPVSLVGEADARPRGGLSTPASVRDWATVDEVLDRVEAELAALTPPPPDGDEPLVFMISMRSAVATRDWMGACERLSSSLRTILSQSDRNFHVYVAGHERPDIAELNSPKVTWMTVEFDPPRDVSGYSGDKTAKRREIGAYLHRIGYRGYTFAMDADDWVHKRFVEYIRRRRVTVPQFLDAGFVANFTLNLVWNRSSETGSAFYRGCGTSSVNFFEPADFPVDSSRAASKAVRFRNATGSHKTMPDVLQGNGEHVAFITIPLAVWVLGHGNNNTLIKGKREFATSHANAENFSGRFCGDFRFQ